MSEPNRAYPERVGEIMFEYSRYMPGVKLLRIDGRYRVGVDALPTGKHVWVMDMITGERWGRLFGAKESDNRE